MYQYKGMEDTIAAVSTPSGTGGIGIVRLSGGDAVAVADKVFTDAKGRIPSQFKSFSVHYGHVRDHAAEGQIVDEVLLTIMRAPKSYTREDVVEISCHGGMVVLRAILMLLLENGARLAEPGEFTKRAFLNGRIDLTQAEAVLDVIRSRTDAFLKVSTHQLKGELTAQLESIREQLLAVYTELEAIVNFPEDDIDARSRAKISGSLETIGKRVEALLLSGEQGRILREGIKIVLCGRPNTGKSLLLNVLLKQPRAIVSEIAGTTRDTIEESAQIRGIPFQLVDTAGILEPRDLIEEEAVKRSHLSIASADLILFLVDASRDLTQDDETLYAGIKARDVLIVLNKSDLAGKVDEAVIKDRFPGKDIIKVSALQKTGIDGLEEAIIRHVLRGGAVRTDGVMITNIRHIDALARCLQSVVGAAGGFRQGISIEFISEEIKSAVNTLDSITGRNIDSDLLDRIFTDFCIGK